MKRTQNFSYHIKHSSEASALWPVREAHSQTFFALLKNPYRERKPAPISLGWDIGPSFQRPKPAGFLQLATCSKPCLVTGWRRRWRYPETDGTSGSTWLHGGSRRDAPVRRSFLGQLQRPPPLGGWLCAAEPQRGDPLPASR